MTSAYIRFLSLVHTLDMAHSQVSGLDETTKHLLRVIGLHHAQGQPLTVTQAMALSAIASPATIHRKLDTLRELDLIEQTFEGSNRRTKYLSPTQTAHDYFDQIGKMIKQSTLAE
jgi:DNA-binding MarR family transcriptional regulator